MESKVAKKNSEKKSQTAVKAAEIGAFDAVAAEKPLKKIPKKSVAAQQRTPLKTVAKTVKKASKTVVVKSPFDTVIGAEAASSTVKKRTRKALVKNVPKVKKKSTLNLAASTTATETEVERSPAFKTLSEPILPILKRTNRARLLMQTPTRLYFYWSIKENPYHLLSQAFGGDTGSYSLVLKMTNLRRGTEEIHQTETEGDWWFSVEPDSEYQAEIGFYAPNRPYFRIIHSNTVDTPRRSPSPRAATDSDWSVSANKFAEVLEVAGFTRDAFDVVLAGDDQATAAAATNTAFTSLIGSGAYTLDGIAADEIRYVLLALASGVTLDQLRWRVSPALFTILQANADKIASGKAFAALSEHFDIDEADFTDEQYGSAVYGASLVNFPTTLKTRRVSSKFGTRYNPVSSFSLGA